MVSDPVLQWVLTLAFSATALHALIHLVRDRRASVQVGNALNLAMSLGMITMAWPWWSSILEVPQALIFGGGAVWFALIIVLQLTRRVTREAAGGHSVWHQVAHAIMMLAMIWMLVAMAPSSTADAAADHAHHHGGLPLAVSLSGLAVTAALVVSGVIFLVEFVAAARGSTGWIRRISWAGHGGDVASGAVMSLGMAAMCWPMITG